MTIDQRLNFKYPEDSLLRDLPSAEHRTSTPDLFLKFYQTYSRGLWIEWYTFSINRRLRRSRFWNKPNGVQKFYKPNLVKNLPGIRVMNKPD
ncbi:MAG: hypothetical protein WEA56_08200 [Balneolaceae bacterium]